MTHYETLGIEPGADAGDIRKAYRKKASQHHPDREGGTDEAMQAINKAFEILSDPAKRARYDAGEKDGMPSVDEMAAKALGQLFQRALDDVEGDALAYCRDCLLGARDKLRQTLADGKKRSAELIRRRTKIKRKSEGENLMHAMIDKSLAQLAIAISDLSKALEVNARVSAMLDDYESTEEPPPPAPGMWQHDPQAARMGFRGEFY